MTFGPVRAPLLVYEVRVTNPRFFETRQAARAADLVGEGLVRLYKARGEAVRARDTGHFIDTIKIRSRVGSNQYQHQRNIASDAFYSRIIEVGWTRRARGQASYPGRWPATQAIQLLDPVIDSAFARAMAR